MGRRYGWLMKHIQLYVLRYWLLNYWRETENGAFVQLNLRSVPELVPKSECSSAGKI